MPVDSGMDGFALRWWAVMSISLLAAILDIRTRRVPNWLSFPAFLAGLVASGWWAGLAGPVWAIASAIIVALPAFVLFLFAGGGAGDVKLLGALGAWLAFRDAVVVLVCVSAAGMVCGLASALLQRRGALLATNLSKMGGALAAGLATRQVRNAQLLMPAEKDMQPFPYGVAICLGAWTAAGVRWLWQW